MVYPIDPRVLREYRCFSSCDSAVTRRRTFWAAQLVPVEKKREWEQEATQIAASDKPSLEQSLQAKPTEVPTINISCCRLPGFMTICYDREPSPPTLISSSSGRVDPISQLQKGCVPVCTLASWPQLLFHEWGM